MVQETFEWDKDKNLANREQHDVSFEEAQYAFFDPNRIIAHDEKHSAKEERWFCIGKVNDRVLTVRFTYGPVEYFMFIGRRCFRTATDISDEGMFKKVRPARPQPF